MQESSFSPTILVSREEVESGDCSQVLELLKHLITTPEIAKMYREQIDICFSGYDNHRDELFEIQGVRDFVHRLDAQFPYWLYFLTKSGLGLQCLMFCFLTPHLKDSAKTEHHPKELEQLLTNRWFPAMNAVCQFAGLDEEGLNELTDRSISYFINGRFKEE